MAQSAPFLPLAGSIRELGTPDLPLFLDHLLRLDPASRRDRFNGVTDENFLEAYATRCFGDGTTVIAHIADGAVRGAAELHERKDGEPHSAEIAFSVEKEWQNRGIGSRLFERLIGQALMLGYKILHVTTHPHNEAMKGLARKFGARLTFANLETVGAIDLTGLGADASRSPARRADPNMGQQSGDLAQALAGLTRAVADFQITALGLRRNRTSD